MSFVDFTEVKARCSIEQAAKLLPRDIGQMPQKHDDGISDLSKLLSIGADPVEDFGLGLRRA